VFVREEVAPSASVMIRLARGRQLADSQVTAITNLVAGAVPGLSIDKVQIADQHGRLLSQPKGENSDRFDLQARMEGKLRAQVEQLLGPMIGNENFTSEIQVVLDMNEVTSARESYDKDGAVRRETTQSSQSTAGTAMGVPGVLSNTPPPDAEARPGAPEGTPAQAGGTQGSGERSASRTYELGREVAVSNIVPGSVKRLSVAVALNQEALNGAKAGDIKKFEQLVSAAVGADPARGDTVAVIVRPFQATEMAAVPVWETAWFATLLRYAVALIAVLLVLLLAVRPLVKAVTRRKESGDSAAEGDMPIRPGMAVMPAGAMIPQGISASREQLSAQIELAQRIVREQPDDALRALRRMLGGPREIEGAQP